MSGCPDFSRSADTHLLDICRFASNLPIYACPIVLPCRHGYFFALYESQSGISALGMVSNVDYKFDRHSLNGAAICSGISSTLSRE